MKLLNIFLPFLLYQHIISNVYYFQLREIELDYVVNPRNVVDFIKYRRELTSQSQRQLLKKFSYLKPNLIQDIRSYWISNLIRVEFNKDFVPFIKNIFDTDDLNNIVDVFEEKQYYLNYTLNDNYENSNWGFDKIKVSKMWQQGYTGKNIIVSNIDTGVRYTHERLYRNYRGSKMNSNNYNWYDPYYDTQYPTDENGHGTHVMGTTIEIAKDAEWIATRGCGKISCSTRQLLESAEYLMCPTKLDGSAPDCNMRPHIINNSWGGGQGDNWFNDIIRNWLKVGIIPVFAAGNSGPACSTTNSPSDSSVNVLSVCATDINDNIASFSSRGPTTNGVKFKPDICAPGVNIYSSWIDSDNSYISISGTSMATPHISGVIALLLQRDMSLRYDYPRLQNLLYNMVETNLKQTDNRCGPSYVFPNNYYGYGRFSF
jgi:subtilisin family serine protease